MLHHQNIDSVQDLSHYGSATHQQVLSSNWHIVGPMLLKGTDVCYVLDWGSIQMLQ
jgi:hypothetical protein